jgi:hypothetical protein
VLSVLPDGSYRSEIGDPRQKDHNREYERGKRLRKLEVDSLQVRVIDYKIPNRDGRDEFIRLITTILDPVEASAAELAAVYHERWEEESVLDEIETDIRGGSNVILRSKHAETVRQEIWALFLAHYAVRHLMTEAAEQADVDVDRISFIRSFRAIRRQVSDQAAFPPTTLEQANRETISEILEKLNPPRRHRSCPRAVKKTHSRYKKKTGPASTRHNSPPSITIHTPTHLRQTSTPSSTSKNTK